jgi:copper transport protein
MALLLIVAVSGTASAHGQLKSALPAAGSHLVAVPRSLRLDFTEVPELEFSTVRLIGPGRLEVALGPMGYAPDSHRALFIPIMSALSAGTYTVLWQMAGDDGHPMRGQFDFTIAPGAMGVGVPPANVPPGDTAGMQMHQNPVTMPEGNGFGADSPIYVVIRWLQFVALLIIIGAVAFRQLVLGFLRRKEDPDSPMLADAGSRAAAIGYVAVGVLLLSALLRLITQSYAMHGAAGVWNGGQVLSMIDRTVWGRGWLLQVVAAAIAGFGLHRARQAGVTGRGWGLATLGAVVLAFTPAFAGHAASAPRLLPVAILADGLHVLGAGGWLGSLCLVVLAGLPAAMRLTEGERGPMVAELINAFSPTALVFAGLVAGTGTFAAWIHVGTVPALWQTTYGKTLLLKLGILSIVALTGAYNWLRVKPTLGQVAGAERIRKSATIELAVGIAVLIVTAVLVASPTPMDMRM